MTNVLLFLALSIPIVLGMWWGLRIDALITGHHRKWRDERVCYAADMAETSSDVIEFLR